MRRPPPPLQASASRHRSLAKVTGRRVGGAPAAQHGQALVLGLLFVFAIAGVGLFMFNSGRAVDEKMRITNAADTAAYSVALMEARALNYHAYANRALVANQVAIAQAVSLISWLQYFESGRNNLDRLSGVISSWIFDPAEYPRLAQLLATLGAAAHAGGGSDAGISSLQHLLTRLISAHDAASSAISASQLIMQASLASGNAQRALAANLLAEVDADLEVELNPASHDYPVFVRRYGRTGSSGDERGRLADVVMRSRDEFTRARSWNIRGPDIPLLQRNVRLKRRGGTDLIGYDEWRALDTLEHEGQRLRRTSWGWRWRWRRTPIAGAAASLGASGEADPRRGIHGNSYRDNAITSARLAEPSMVALRSAGARFSGLPATHDLRQLGVDGAQRSGLTLRVAKRRERLRTSGGSSIIQPAGRLQQFDRPIPSREMAAIARAEVFFDRPHPRSDGRTELPSLYSPFWQVRLANPTAADHAWASVRQGGLFLP